MKKCIVNLELLNRGGGDECFSQVVYRLTEDLFLPQNAIVGTFCLDYHCDHLKPHSIFKGIRLPSTIDLTIRTVTVMVMVTTVRVSSTCWLLGGWVIDAVSLYG